METEDLCFLYFAIPWPLGEGFPLLYFEASSHRSNMVSYSLYEKYIYIHYIYTHIHIHTVDEIQHAKLRIYYVSSHSKRHAQGKIIKKKKRIVWNMEEFVIFPFVFFSLFYSPMILLSPLGQECTEELIFFQQFIDGAYRSFFIF